MSDSKKAAVDPQPLLNVAQVCARYGDCDRRTARNIMDAAGAFTVAGTLWVRIPDLEAWEEKARQRRRVERRAWTVKSTPASGSKSSVPHEGELDEFWWEEA